MTATPNVAASVMARLLTRAKIELYPWTARHAIDR
jgi:hypothetical protein